MTGYTPLAPFLKEVRISGAGEYRTEAYGRQDVFGDPFGQCEGPQRVCAKYTACCPFLRMPTAMTREVVSAEEFA